MQPHFTPLASTLSIPGPPNPSRLSQAGVEVAGFARLGLFSRHPARDHLSLPRPIPIIQVTLHPVRRHRCWLPHADIHHPSAVLEIRDDQAPAVAPFVIRQISDQAGAALDEGGSDAFRAPAFQRRGAHVEQARGLCGREDQWAFGDRGGPRTLRFAGRGFSAVATGRFMGRSSSKRDSRQRRFLAPPCSPPPDFAALGIPPSTGGRACNLGACLAPLTRG